MQIQWNERGNVAETSMMMGQLSEVVKEWFLVDRLASLPSVWINTNIFHGLVILVSRKVITIFYHCFCYLLSFAIQTTWTEFHRKIMIDIDRPWIKITINNCTKTTVKKITDFVDYPSQLVKLSQTLSAFGASRWRHTSWVWIVYSHPRNSWNIEALLIHVFHLICLSMFPTIQHIIMNFWIGTNKKTTTSHFVTSQATLGML